MTPEQIQQKIFFGYAKAASKLGAMYNLYRSSTPINPIQSGNLVGQVRMSPSVSWDYMKALDYGKAAFNACLDAQSSSSPLNCRVGDYLVPVADTAAQYNAASISIVSGGSNYAVGDYVMLSGGTPVQYVVLSVVTVNGSGAITSATIYQAGNYNYPVPSNPLGQYYTTGNGNGATFNVIWSGGGIIDDNNTYYVQSLQFNLPPRVVICNRTISIIRPSQQTGPGYVGYQGYTPGTSINIMTGMPASVLKGGRGENAPTNLPTDTREPMWPILMPNLGNVTLRTDDIVIDDLNQEYVISVAEATLLGWRIDAIQVVNSR